MTLASATLIPGVILAFIGLGLLLNQSSINSVLKGMPRSGTAALILFGGGAAWFLYRVWHLSPADFGDYRRILFVIFLSVAVLSFRLVPDFLAVRGLSVLILVGAMPLLDAAYMEYEHPQRLLMVSIVFLAICAAIWLGAQPWRLRDFFEWLFRRPGRSRGVGAALLACGVALAGVSFTY